MKITCIPLDIRPYNFQFLEEIAAFDKRVNLTMPLISELGANKVGANINYLHDYLNSNQASDALIIAMDTFLYGGLFPARIHNQKEFSAQFRLLRDLKHNNPQMKIYASSLILRTPAYNSNLEEPDYYQDYGLDIFNWGVLKDKIDSNACSNRDIDDFNYLDTKIPKEYLDDFINRRIINRNNILKMIEMVDLDIIDVLIIPQDDASTYGHTAIDQKIIYHTIYEKNLSSRIFLHPGTDESGCTLLARAFTDYFGQPSMSVLYLSEHFKKVVPFVEDRPFEDSLNSHASAIGLKIDQDNYDFVLGISGAPKVMQEACYIYYGSDRIGHKLDDKPAYNRMDLSYYRMRNFNQFISKLRKFKQQHTPIAILDAAFGNGGEFQLVKALDEAMLIEYMSGYAGWNTTCNSLGSLLTTMVFALNNHSILVEEFKLQRIANDLIYCSKVGIETNQHFLKTIDAYYNDFNNQEKVIMNHIKEEVEYELNQLFLYSYLSNDLIVEQVSAPFKRLTGLSFNIKIK
ncbi:MAG: DUF4127 family protein [Bacilli bacterium]